MVFEAADFADPSGRRGFWFDSDIRNGGKRGDEGKLIGASAADGAVFGRTIALMFVTADFADPGFHSNLLSFRAPWGALNAEL